jgi:alcohol dehydrogenase class IV
MTNTQDLVLWSFPTRVVLGEGAAAQCANEAHQLGATRVLLVSDRGIEEAGVLDSVRNALDAAGLPHESALDVSSNPLEAEVLGAARAFDDFKADLVLGVGGGSVLDVAKLTSAVGEAGAYVEGIEVARHLMEHARRLGLETPISSTFVAVSEGRIGPDDAIQALMERHVGKE